MDRTVSYIRQELGRIKRLSVALAVDDLKVVDPQTGEVSYEPWPEQELQRLTMLVRDAVGYSAARGDSVTVMNTSFAAAGQNGVGACVLYTSDAAHAPLPVDCRRRGLINKKQPLIQRE